MKIYILGPSGSGKTTLAKKLSSEMNIRHVTLDNVLYDYVNKKRIKRSLRVINDEIIKLSKDTESWIVEGVYVIHDLLNISDKVIFIDEPLYKLLYRQWKRFCTDTDQRSQHGFRNNVKMSWRLVRKYLFHDSTKINDIYHWDLKKQKLAHSS